MKTSRQSAMLVSVLAVLAVAAVPDVALAQAKLGQSSIHSIASFHMIHDSTPPLIETPGRGAPPPNPILDDPDYEWTGSFGDAGVLPFDGLPALDDRFSPTGGPVPIPEPATLALLAVGALASFRRRRRR